jgi:hypothetical protein
VRCYLPPCLLFLALACGDVFGIDLVARVQLSDNPFPADRYQSGLYFLGATTPFDRPKFALTAFRFPFVAFDANGRLRVWGRVPPAAAPPLWTSGQAVAIERKTSSGWRRVRLLNTNSQGIFSARWRSTLTRGALRARVVATNESSFRFSLTRPRDRFLVKGPFGCGGHIAC